MKEVLYVLKFSSEKKKSTFVLYHKHSTDKQQLFDTLIKSGAVLQRF